MSQGTRWWPALGLIVVVAFNRAISGRQLDAAVASDLPASWRAVLGVLSAATADSRPRR